MAAKISTIILTVDLDCYICSKKIRKTISKLEGREQIQSVNYDEKNNTVTITGLFDPEKLKKKLLCKASKVIKEIKIKEDPPKEKPKPAEPEKPKEKPKPAEPEKPKEKPKPAEPEKPKEKPKPAEPEKPKEQPKPAEPEKPKEKPKPAEPEKPKEQPKPAEPEKPKEKPKPAEPEKPKEQPKPAEPAQPVWPVGPPLPGCCWRPCYEPYYGGCRCCSCGMFFGWSAPPFPPPGGYTCGPSASTCQFFCEEDPSSCTIM